MAKAAATKAKQEVLPAIVEEQDEVTVQQTGQAVISFLKGLAAFFTEARRLEARATSTLEYAKKLEAPTNSQQDEAIQKLCKVISTDKKEVEGHWTITATVSQFHRRLTGRRDVSVSKLEEASKIANRLHNEYTERERKRAAAEQERLHREAEAKAQRERDAELFRMETEALNREAASPDLSDRERAFVDLVVAGVSASQAAYRVGYKDTTRGLKMLEMKKIATAIKAKQEAIAIRNQAAARRVEPLEPYYVPEIKPDVSKAAGATERTTHEAELLDEQKLIAAVISGGLGIPWDILTVKPAKLNEYARSLHERINLWPGVRYKKDTKVI